MFSSFEGPDRRKEEDRIRKEGRLPPGQSLTFKFPVLHYGPVPHFSPATWDFRVWGEVEEEKRWTWAEFNQLPRSKIEMDIHCVTRWSKFDTVWAGVSVKTMVESGLIKIKPSATHVMQHAEYGFTVNLPLEVALQEISSTRIRELIRSGGSWEHLVPDGLAEAIRAVYVCS
jgi:DMSO/TMAO reductase YedYZ molybdopterin-dependent catalytic subunit